MFERVSTGKTSVLDSPSNILRISRLESDIRANGAATRNIQDGVSLIQTANGTLDTVNSIAQRLRELSVLYHNGSLSYEDLLKIEEEAKSLTEEISSTLKSAQFNGVQIFGKDSYSFQVGRSTSDQFKLQIPGIVMVRNSEVSKEQREVTRPTMFLFDVSESRGQKMKVARFTNHDRSNNDIPHYTLPAPDISQIPDQQGYTGYKRIFDEDGNLLYEGNLTNGVFDGYGKFYDQGKLTYEGDWKKGIYSGFGTLYDQRGDVLYRGDIRDGTPSGWGTIYENGKMKYQGGLQNGYRQGWGTTYDEHGKYFGYSIKYGFNSHPFFCRKPSLIPYECS